MSYSDPFIQTITVIGTSGLSTAGAIFSGQGPVGKTGRILQFSFAMTTANSGAAGGIDVGTIADDDAYGTLSSAAVQADNTAVVATAAQLAAMLDLPADTLFAVSGDGVGTAGVCDLSMTIGWS
jgi:hypothetical protein